jgi:ABC-2 type transport system permease protein
MSATWHGISTMAGQEFRLRLRAGRWRWLLASWFVLLCGFTALVRLAVGHSNGGSGSSYVDSTDTAVISNPTHPLGTPMFGALMLFLLGLALLVVPALTAQSVNGDREHGVLASLQTTLLTPADIALGKLLAAWATAMVFLVAAVPLVIWSMFEGGVAVGRALIAMVVVALLLGVVAAVAQCLSAVLARGTTSAVLSYLFVFGLTMLTLISFGLALSATTSEHTVTQQVPVFDGTSPDAAPRFENQTYTESTADPSKVWWLLAPNPFVILADAAPRARRRCDLRTGLVLSDPLDPLGEIGNSVRKARTPKSDAGSFFFDNPCQNTAGLGRVEIGSSSVNGQPVLRKPAGPVWPYGLAFDLLLGIGAVLITIRRLRTPTRALPKGVRVA